MYVLYFYPGNANLAPHFALEEIGAPYRLELVDRGADAQKSDAYMALNPNGRIPVLLDGDLVLYEAAAICLHLADRHPDAGLAPPVASERRAHLYKWLMWLTNTVQTECLIYHYPHRHTADPAGVPSVKAAAEERLNAMFDQVDGALTDRPYLIGDQFSLCDLYLLMVCRFARSLTRPPRTLPRLGSHLDHIAERPAVQRAFASEGISAPYY